MSALNKKETVIEPLMQLFFRAAMHHVSAATFADAEPSPKSESAPPIDVIEPDRRRHR